MMRLFHRYGLVYIDPNLPTIRALAAPLMERAIHDPLTPSRLVNDAGERLQKAGFKRQITRPPENCAFFIFEDGYRQKVVFEGGEFHTDGCRYTSGDLKKLLKTDPERFSAGVVMRPAMSEYLFKSVVSVGGPGEIGYFAQLKDVYAHFDVPMPAALPRLSLTLLEGRIQKILTTYGLDYRELENETGGIISKVVRQQADFLSDDYWQDIIKNTLQPICHLRDEVEKKDKSFIQPIDTTLNKMSWQVGQLQNKIVQIAKKSEEKIDRQIVSAKTNIFPDNDLLERQLNIFYFLNKYGPEFIDRLIRDSPAQYEKHHVMNIVPD
jgi:bacillithiol biosynthesis cysteine-adding enzyme BshC